MFKNSMNNYLSLTLNLGKTIDTNEFIWNTEMQNKFDDLKEKIASRIKPGAPNLPYMMFVHATPKYYGALIAQNVGDQQNVVSVKFQKLDKNETEMNLNEVNLDACLWSLREFESELFEKDYTVYINAQIIDYESNFKLKPKEIEKLLLLQEYNVNSDLKKQQYLFQVLQNLCKLLNNYG
jgi:hypothetical protein